MDFTYCGLDCSECPVYLATIRKNTDEQIKLANEYSTDVTKFSKDRKSTRLNSSHRP